MAKTKACLSVFLIALMISGSALVVSVHFSVRAQPAEANASAQWMPDSALVNGLPELGIIGDNSQCLIFNLTGNSQWVLIIGQYNGWTVNEYPFLGYYWNGSQWVSNPALVQGLIAYPNENDPTVGFNITGDNTFDMIVAQWDGGWTGYAWNGSQWVVNTTLINGLPTNADYGGGDNYASLGYNVLGDSKWDLIVDNYGNNGYVGFEWNGTAWTQENSLVNGLPNAGSPSDGDQFPVPCLAYNFANDNASTLIVGLASGGGSNGTIQGFQWSGTAWTLDPAIVEGVTDLQPCPNTPTIAYNVTGDGNWVLIIGSATTNVKLPAYYTGYYWSALATSTPTSIPTPPTPTSAPSATTVPATTDNGSTVYLAISGNITNSQMSNITITTNQSATSTTVSFTVTGPSGTTGFSNITIPKTALTYGTTPTIYIDNQPAQNQGYTQDTNNYYVWYTTHFSTHKISIVFTKTSSSTNLTSQSSLLKEVIYGVAVAVVIVTIVLVGLYWYLGKARKAKAET